MLDLSCLCDTLFEWGQILDWRPWYINVFQCLHIHTNLLWTISNLLHFTSIRPNSTFLYSILAIYSNLHSSSSLIDRFSWVLSDNNYWQFAGHLYSVSFNHMESLYSRCKLGGTSEYSSLLLNRSSFVNRGSLQYCHNIFSSLDLGWWKQWLYTHCELWIICSLTCYS